RFPGQDLGQRRARPTAAKIPEVLRRLLRQPAEDGLQPRWLGWLGWLFPESFDPSAAETFGTRADQFEAHVGNGANLAMAEAVCQEQDNVGPPTDTGIVATAEQLQEGLALFSGKEDTAIHGLASGFGVVFATRKLKSGLSFPPVYFRSKSA